MSAQRLVEERLVDLPGRTPLAVRTHRPSVPADQALARTDAGADREGGAGVPFVLVHGLASNARLWDGVAAHLAAAGHPGYAVDQRGHGLSPVPEDGYDTDTCADDLAALIAALGLDRPVLAGQSWGGNVVLSLAARHPELARAVACVDGGWIRLGDRFATFEECWAALAPPSLENLTWSEVEGWIRGAHADWPPDSIEATLANLVRTPGGGVRARLDRAHHRQILRSLFQGDPASWYPEITVPVLLVPATGEADAPPGVGEALAGLADARVVYYPGAHHDVHAQHPERLAADLLTLVAVPAD